MIIRTVVVMGLYPLLNKSLYGLSWREAAVVIYGGLRGSVGLALALMLMKTVPDKRSDEILVFAAGIVSLTLIVNGSTVNVLLQQLGMSELSPQRKEALYAAQERLRTTVDDQITALKAGTFIQDADWNYVREYVCMFHPHPHPIPSLFPFPSHMFVIDYPQLVERPAITQHDDEASSARHRFLKAEKQMYWAQFEQGILGHDAIQVLSAAIDAASDDGERMLSSEDLLNHHQVPEHYAKLQNLPFIGIAIAPPPSFSLQLYRISARVIHTLFVYRSLL